MMAANLYKTPDEIENRIFTIRGIAVMIDRDLALYQVETKYINRAVKRNPDRFPDGFVFQLSSEEFAMIQKFIRKINTETLRFQTGTIDKSSEAKKNITPLKTGRGSHSKYMPWAFTEEGVAMLSAHRQQKIVSCRCIAERFRKALFCLFADG